MRWLRDAAPLLDRFVIGPIPSLGNGGQSPFLPSRLEAQPAISEFRRYGSTRQSFFQSALQPAPPLSGVASRLSFDSSLEESALGGLGMHLPHIPDPALPILELSMSHTDSRGVRYVLRCCQFLARASGRIREQRLLQL